MLIRFQGGPLDGKLREVEGERKTFRVHAAGEPSFPGGERPLYEIEYQFSDWVFSVFEDSRGIPQSASISEERIFTPVAIRRLPGLSRGLDKEQAVGVEREP